MTVDVLIVGAGFAGAATAFHLSRRFSGSILIAEKEALPGQHASGRNARLVFQQLSDPRIRPMVVESCRAYRAHGDELGFSPQGSLLLGHRAELERLARTQPPSSTMVEAETACRRVPPLAEHACEAALWTPSDGVMPVDRLLRFYLEGAAGRGTSMQLNAEVAIEDPGPPLLVRVGGRRIEAGVVVNAAGAWADELVRSLSPGLSGLRPLKRHLFVVDSGTPPPADTPFVWDLALDFYLRPEGAGWLISLCEELPDRRPEDESVEPQVLRDLETLLRTHLPSLAGARIVRSWSCFRTHPVRGAVQLGWDPVVEGLFWVAGLGGNGMGSSWAVGRKAAGRLLQRL